MMPRKLAKWHREYRKQRKEHPTLSAYALRIVVSDHVRAEKKTGKSYG